ncbi:hypothetical protein BJ742DRAFT_787461 [Cladochytrium replicatum]|nr:hypothetical protein BJ742DRAFT_787461 [Cladochytrium replicatum]
MACLGTSKTISTPSSLQRVHRVRRIHRTAMWSSLACPTQTLSQNLPISLTSKERSCIQNGSSTGKKLDLDSYVVGTTRKRKKSPVISVDSDNCSDILGQSQPHDRRKTIDEKPARLPAYAPSLHGPKWLRRTNTIAGTEFSNIAAFQKSQTQKPKISKAKTFVSTITRPFQKHSKRKKRSTETQPLETDPIVIDSDDDGVPAAAPRAGVEVLSLSPSPLPIHHPELEIPQKQPNPASIVNEDNDDVSTESISDHEIPSIVSVPSASPPPSNPMQTKPPHHARTVSRGISVPSTIGSASTRSSNQTDRELHRSSSESSRSTTPRSNSCREKHHHQRPHTHTVDPRYINVKEACLRPHPLNHHNKKLVEALCVIENERRLKSEERNALSYRIAIAALISYPRAITSYKEAIKIKGIGLKIAHKIKEFLRSGRIEEAETIKLSESFQVRSIFSSIYGVGPKTASEWYRKGYRTISDLHDFESDRMSHTQRQGLLLYPDFSQKMSRVDVDELLWVLRTCLDAIDPGLEMTPVGGYRRGKELCGDLDVVIGDPNRASVDGLLSKIVDELKRGGLVNEILHYYEGASMGVKEFVRVEKVSKKGREGGGIQRGGNFDELSKCFCAMLQPSTGIKRQVDIIVSPYEGLIAHAILGWSGSTLYERSLRNICKKRGLHFTSHGLYDRRTLRRIVGLKSEREICQRIGVPYFEASLRNA